MTKTFDFYLACPYSDPDPLVREARFVKAAIYAAALMRRGYKVFCPIVHCHPMAVYGGLPKGYDYWRKYNEATIKASRAMLVLRTDDGWVRSTGVEDEARLADALGMPVTHVELINEWEDPSELLRHDPGRPDNPGRQDAEGLQEH